MKRPSIFVSLLLLSQLVAATLVFASNSTLACVDVNSVPLKDQCAFVRAKCNTRDHNIGIFNYLLWYYCGPLRLFSISSILSVLVVTFISLGLTASDYLCPNLYSISKFLQLSDNLAGLTLLAVGNGSADVLSTFKALSIGSAGLAISELLGAALFILTVVVGSICIVNPFKVPRSHFLRDTSFYLVVTGLLAGSLFVGQFNYYNSVVLFSLYIVYVIVAISSDSWLKESSRKKLSAARTRSNYENAPVVPEVDSYFDSFANLPSIDILSTTHEEGHNSDGEFETYLSSHPHHPHEERAPVRTGTYGLRVLLRELSKHSIHLLVSAPLLSRVFLANERPLTAPVIIEVTDTEADPTNEQSLLFGLRRSSLLADILFALLPEWEPESSFLSKISFVLSTPTNILLRLTTPVREQAIEYGEQSFVSSNAFTFSRPGGSPVAEETDTEFDFALDVWIFKIQFVLACNLVAFAYFRWLKYFWPSWLVVLLVSVVIATAIPSKEPKFETHLLRYRAWNYMGSFLGFVLSLLWISFFANESIAILKTLSLVLELSDDILGATVFALGNSIGDLVSNLIIARMGMPVMAFGACFGGPLLSLCSMGLSSVVVMSESDVSAIRVQFSPTLQLNIFALFVSLVFIMIVVPRNDWMFDRKIGVILIAWWVISVVLSVVLEVTKSS